MTVGLLLDMAGQLQDGRVAIGARDNGLQATEISERVTRGATEILKLGARHVAFVGVNSVAVPLSVLSACVAGVPVTPLNYRLGPGALRELLARLDRPLVIVDQSFTAAVGPVPHAERVLTTEEWLELLTRADAGDPPAVADESTAVMLFTSGTTSAPKGVLLRHSHLVSYVLRTVEFASAGTDEAALVSVPPYHVAGIGTILTNLYAGRRIVYLADFTPQAWLELVRRERITSAMVVPTMLARIVEHLGDASADLPTLRAIAYGGARLPQATLRKALAAFPDVGFTNAYGLTETSSTIAVLTPDDHRAALRSPDPAVRVRLGSVGRLVAGVEGQIRGRTGEPVHDHQVGELWVRGAQVSGEYAGSGSVLDTEGWFPTRDRAHFDTAGYLFVDGRDDDTIIRGGENISPAEIEEVLATHPHVLDCAVFGVADEHWGDRIVAALVLRPDSTTRDGPDPEEFRAWVRTRLRSARTPDQILFAPELPYTATGKLLRRELINRTNADPRGPRPCG
jgi:acyl-CoA synthetase (AMP-forming)/AMP-acid ligase II